MDASMVAYVPGIALRVSQFTASNLEIRRECACPLAKRSSRYAHRLSMIYGYGVDPEAFQIKVMEKNRCTVVGAKKGDNLRSQLKDAKVDIYTLKGKLQNCGGNGVCGLCRIDVIENPESLTPRTLKEDVMMKKYPASWRLACRTTVQGPGLVVETKPEL